MAIKNRKPYAFFLEENLFFAVFSPAGGFSYGKTGGIHMEKFGIFELLDALSAACDAAAPPPPSEDSPSDTGASREEMRASEGNSSSKRAPDAAFLAPSYGEQQAPPPSSGSAIDGFYARHEHAKSKAKRG